MLMMGMETSLIPYFLGQADEDSTLQVVSDATILTRWQANFWITGITKRLWDCIPCGVRTMLAWLERAGSSVLNILLFIHILPPLLLQTSLYLESWHFHFSVHFFFFLAAFWQFWLCHHAILGQKAWTQDGLPVICRVFWFLLDPALMVWCWWPTSWQPLFARKIRSVWRWSIYKFSPQKDGTFLFLWRPNKTMGFYVLEHVTPVKFLGPSFWVSMFISGEGEKTPIVFLS